MQNVTVNYWPRVFGDSVAVECLKELLASVRNWKPFLGEKREDDCVRWRTLVQESASCCNTSFPFAFAVVVAPCFAAVIRGDSTHFPQVLSRTTSATSPPF